MFSRQEEHGVEWGSRSGLWVSPAQLLRAHRSLTSVALGFPLCTVRGFGVCECGCGGPRRGAGGVTGHRRAVRALPPSQLREVPQGEARVRQFGSARVLVRGLGLEAIQVLL